MMRTLAGAAVLALTLSGCGETRSVEYFKAHPEEAREIKMRCAANGMAGAECGNAVTARNALQHEALAQTRGKKNRNREEKFPPVIKKQDCGHGARSEPSSDSWRDRKGEYV